MATAPTDDRYLDLILDPIRTCANYRPAFGKATRRRRADEDEEEQDEEGVSIQQFHVLYGADPLYHWIGLDSDLVYAAHKAAGGMTSVYRQLGIGCERLVREVIRDTLSISEDDAKWSYSYDKGNGVMAIHTLDVRIDLDALPSERKRRAVRGWLDRCGTMLTLSRERAAALRGVVLEVRQGYKSADSKRQNADLRFGMRAANENYLSAIMVVSSQVSEPVRRRYQAALIPVLVGTRGADTSSTFTFFSDVVGYDLAAFFERNSPRLRAEFTEVLQALLTPA
ncbi:MAG: TilS substrate-binding domain-containing protein [Candidatus Eisenbacteria bacterium]|nr:TilS substrate-binding domain-containing protein [Candidatus Eisenbacteria bacterium]